MIDASPNFPLTLTNVLWAVGAATAIAGAAVGLTWHVRKDRIEGLQDELRTLRGAEDWKLPDTLRSLKELSDKAHLEVAERQQLEQLKERNAQLSQDLQAKSTSVDALKARVVELEKTVTQAQTERQELQELKERSARLSQDLEAKSATVGELKTKIEELEGALAQARTTGTEFDLGVGKTHVLLAPDLVIGVKSIYSTWVDIVLQNISRNLSVGEQVELKHAAHSYVLTLLAIESGVGSPKAKFSFYSRTSEISGIPTPAKR